MRMLHKGGGGAAIKMMVLSELLLLLTLLTSAMVVAVVGAAESTSVIALALPQSNTTSGYFPLSTALRSIMRLAASDINAEALATATSTSDFDEDSAFSSFPAVEGNLTLSIVEVATGNRAIEGLCDALASVGENGTFGIVGPMLSSQASLLETVSNDFFGLPMFTPSATAARAATYFTTGARDVSGDESYLFGIQPDVFEEMKAVARLILDMKLERDLARGWYRATERVSLIYPDDIYGTIAASAFARAARSTEGINIDSNAAGEMPATIEIVKSKPLDAIEGTDHRPTLRSLLQSHASIVVFLSEGYDGVFVRSVLEQAREVGLIHEGVQWYLSGTAAMDGTFTWNDTYHDSQLAYDLRGALGVRACPSITGPGSETLASLTSRWAALDTDLYPGAGLASLSPDGRLDPLLAYAYDAVSAAARAIFSVKETAAGWGGALEGFVADSCPFRTQGLWDDGEAIRQAALTTDMVGVTGRIYFQQTGSVVTSGAGTAGTGWRKANGTEFCALNLQPHATLGGTFATTMTWKPETFVDVNKTEAVFEKLSAFQKNQTFPSGGDVYPFDRPTLSRQHFEIVTEASAAPFFIRTGLGNETTYYKGISMDLMKTLSDQLGFTYSISVANSSVSTEEVIGYVANGAYDMVASSVTITEPRLEYVSFSYPYLLTGLSFVYRPDTANKVSWWKVFQPFEAPLWAAVIFTTIVMSALLWFFDGAKNGLFTDGVPSATGSKRRFKTGMAMSSFVTGALLLGQMAHEPYSLESYVLTTGWMFGCFVLASSFTAELAAFLSAEKEQALSFTVDDLKNGAVPHGQVAVQEGTKMQTFYESVIMQCSGSTDCYGGEDPDVPVACYSLEECFELVQNGTCKATIVDSVVAAYRVADEYCGLDILSDTFNDEHFGLVLPKDSPFLTELETALLDLQEGGVLTDLFEPYFDSSRCAYLEAYQDASASSQNLTLVDLAGVFMILGMFALASIVLWTFRRPPAVKPRWSLYRENQAKRQLADMIKREQKALPPTTVAEELDMDKDTNINSWPALSTQDQSLSRRSRPSSSKSPGRRQRRRQPLSPPIEEESGDVVGGSSRGNGSAGGSKGAPAARKNNFYSFSPSYFNSSSSASSAFSLSSTTERGSRIMPTSKSESAPAADESLPERLEKANNVDKRLSWVISSTAPQRQNDGEVKAMDASDLL